MFGSLRVGALLCKPLGVLVGFVYPAFASWKALESQKSDNGVAHAGANGSWQNRDAWLTYWVVFSCFNVLEHVADVLISWMPLYYVAKLAFVIWLQAPQTRGATVLHVQYISPLLRKHEGVIDNALEEGLRKGEATLLEFRTRSERYFRGGRPSEADAEALGSAADRSE